MPFPAKAKSLIAEVARLPMRVVAAADGHPGRALLCLFGLTAALYLAGAWSPEQSDWWGQREIPR